MKWHLNHPVHKNKPWAVQAEALKRAAGKAKFGYWLEQGLGKTSLALNEFIDQDETDVHFVVCPNSFKGDWALAPEEWGVDWLPSGYWPKHPLPFEEGYFNYAINYEAVREKSNHKLLHKLFEQRNIMLTIDESTAIKNPGSNQFRAVMELAKRAKIVRELNGTPLTHDVTDYYGQLRVLGQLNGVTPTMFKSRYAEVGGFFGKQVTGTRNEEEIARIIDSCTFRALKKDWRKDLPPKIYIPVHLEMSKRQRQHYATMMEEFYAMVDGDEITATLVLTQMGKLRQISSCVLMDKGKEYFFEEPKDNPKLKAVFDILAGTPGKTIVSHYYKASGKLLYDALAKFEPAVIRGGMKPEDLVEQKRRFNDDPGCRVLVGQQDATARGHTLIGQTGLNRCSTMIFYENDFSYYWRAQMEDRNNRGAQDQDCNVYDLVTSPMDQLTVNTLTKRKDLASMMDEIIAAVRGAK